MQNWINLLALAIGISALAVPDTFEKCAGVQYEDNVRFITLNTVSP